MNKDYPDISYIFDSLSSSLRALSSTVYSIGYSLDQITNCLELLETLTKNRITEEF